MLPPCVQRAGVVLCSTNLRRSHSVSLSASNQIESRAVRVFLPLLVATLLAGVAFVVDTSAARAQSEAAADEKSEEKDSPEAEPAADEAKPAAADVAAKDTAPVAAAPAKKAAAKGAKTDAAARAGSFDNKLEAAAGPPGWPVGKPAGPGPQGWPEGKTAADFEKPDQEGASGGPEGWNAEDGVGVACTDYIECVCTIADRTKGKPQAGYNHDGTCMVAKTYTTPDYEELCAEELDQLKDALEDAKEDYKANDITLPPSCQ